MMIYTDGPLWQIIARNTKWAYYPVTGAVFEWHLPRGCWAMIGEAVSFENAMEFIALEVY